MRHPRVVDFYDVFEIDVNSFATVLEYCRGIDLDEKYVRTPVLAVVRVNLLHPIPTKPFYAYILSFSRFFIINFLSSGRPYSCSRSSLLSSSYFNLYDSDSKVLSISDSLPLCGYIGTTQNILLLVQSYMLVHFAMQCYVVSLSIVCKVMKF